LSLLFPTMVDQSCTVDRYWGSTTVMQGSKFEPWALIGCSATILCRMYLPLRARCNIQTEGPTFDPEVTCFLACTVQNLYSVLGLVWGLSVGDMAKAVTTLYPQLVCVLLFSNSFLYMTSILCYFVLTFFYDFLWSHYLVVACLIMGVKGT
jgi:hypothetical protein